MILTYILSNWRLIAVGLLVASNATFYGLWRHSANGFSEYKTNVELISEAQAKHTEEVIAQQEQITKETTDGWKAAVDYLHAHPQRVLSRYCGGTGVSGPAQGTDGTGESTILTPARVEEDAASDVLKLNQLQEWIEKQRAVK